MTALIPSQFQDALEACISDLDGQDEMYFHDSAMRTIAWYIGKAKSIVHYSAEIRTHQRMKFLEAVAQRKNIPLRRLQEAVAVYKKESKPSDSVMETSERIFQKYGRWSHALPQKQLKQENVESPELTCGHCPIHCKHEEQV